MKKITPRQKIFCELYTTEGDYFGNATKSYKVAYGHKPHQLFTARTNGPRLLAEKQIKKYINELFKKKFNGTTAKTQIFKTIIQDQDWKAKVDAIILYNKITGRMKRRKK